MKSSMKMWTRKQQFESWKQNIQNSKRQESSQIKKLSSLKVSSDRIIVIDESDKQG